MHVITMPNSSNESRLTAEEVEKFFNFSFYVHDHDAAESAEPIFWWRTAGDDLSRFWN